MSSILRALKKLDEDSISRENTPGEQNVKMKHIVHRPTKTSRVINRALFVVVALLLVVTAILIRGWNPRPQEERTPQSTKEQSPQPQEGQSQEEQSPRPEKNRLSQPEKEQPSQPIEGRALQLQEERPIQPESKQRRRLERMGEGIPPIQRPMGKIPGRKTNEPKPSIKETKHPELSLEGILWSQEAARRLALINNRYLKEGDKIQGVSILQIGKTEVTLQLGDEKWTVRLKK